jgi:hypothetical protein
MLKIELTLRIAKGDNIPDVSKQSGHHSVAFTLDKYAHWLPGEHKARWMHLTTCTFPHPHRTQREESDSNIV